MKKSKRFSNQALGLLTATLLAILVLAPITEASPISDGLFDPTEGYTTSEWVVYDKGVGDGKLYTYRDATTGNLSVALVQSRVYVDNTYGVNAIGWGTKGHKFNDLVGSDKAKFLISDSSGNKLVELELDYISKLGTDPTGQDIYGSKAKLKSPKGQTLDGSMFSTSLDYNFNALGFHLTTDSPLTNENYDTLDPQYAGWIYESVYEFTVAGSLLAEGNLNIGVEAHNSPNKGMRAMPIPGAVYLLGSGLVGLIGLRRKQRG